jgi:hypothetical protein
VPYRGNSKFGNCELCGNFRNLTGVNFYPKAGAHQNHQQVVSQSIRESDQSFRTEVPMDVILQKLIEDA